METIVIVVVAFFLGTYYPNFKYRQIIKFGDKYAIRKGIWPFFVYKDFQTAGFWWTKHDRHFRSSCLTTLENCRKEIALLAGEEIIK